MTNAFKPASLRLFEAVGLSPPEPRDDTDESYRIHEAVIAVSNRIYQEQGDDVYGLGVWQVEPAVLDAARVALREPYRQPYATQDLAHLLARSGARDAEVLERLHPWDQVLQRWHEQGLRAADVESALQAAGAIDALAPEARERIDAWIAEPPIGTLDPFEILDALLGLDRRAVLFHVRDDGYEHDHGGLFTRLLALLDPVVAIDGLEEVREPGDGLIPMPGSTRLVMRTEAGERTFTVGDDPQLAGEGLRIYAIDGRGAVRFRHEGVVHGFAVEANGTWMDLQGVLAGTNRFLQGLGRPERAFVFAGGRDDSHEYRALCVAHGEAFPVTAQRLGLPLDPATAT